MPDPKDPAELSAPAMANLNINRPATSIPCNSFNSDVDHLPDFIPIFENACIVATNPSDSEKESTFLQWFPLKLDKRARNLFNSIHQANKSWAAIWAELKKLLIDPQERYNWRAKKSTIKWDGKETFHALETRVKRAVDLYEDPAVVKSEYFFRFRAALPKEYRKAIDLGCEENGRTIENAKKCALRLQLALADDDDDASSKNVAFSGAAMADNTKNDRLKALEIGFQELSLQIENLSESMQKFQRDDGFASREPDRRADSRSSRREDYSREQDGPRHNNQDHSRRDDYDHSRGDYDRHHNESHGYDRSRDRSRYDRNSNRYDSRDHPDSGKYDNRDRRDSRDRRDNRNQRDNCDHRDNRNHRDSYRHERHDRHDVDDEHDRRDEHRDSRGNDRGYRTRDGSPDRSSDDYD